MTKCENCGGEIKGGDRVIDVRIVSGVVAPGEGGSYITTDRTAPMEYIHMRCPVGVQD